VSFFGWASKLPLVTQDDINEARDAWMKARAARMLHNQKLERMMMDYQLAERYHDGLKEREDSLERDYYELKKRFE